MTRVALAYLPLPASPRPARSCPQLRRKHLTPFSRQPRLQPKPRLGVKNLWPQYAPGLALETHANPPGIIPVAQEAVVGCSVATERGSAKYLSQGFSPAQAEYLAAPYVGKGHHSFVTQAMGRNHNLPSWIVESPLNVLKPKGMSRGDFYELHYKVDLQFRNANFPNAIGGKWTGSSLGLERYSGLERIWHASPTPLKITAGGVTVTGAAGTYYYLGDDK